MRKHRFCALTYDEKGDGRGVASCTTKEALNTLVSDLGVVFAEGFEYATPPTAQIQDLMVVRKRGNRAVSGRRFRQLIGRNAISAFGEALIK